MKSIHLLLFFCTMILPPTHSFDKTISWQFINPKNNSTILLGEKGSIQEALIRDGYLPDPYIGMNEHFFGWIEEQTWELTSGFTLTAEEISSQILDLELPSVDTYAEIYLNGQLILTCNNAFLPYRIAINQWVKAGNNELKAVFTPPVLYHKEQFEHANYTLPAPNDLHEIPIAPYTRKPQYQFGWDWALRMNTIGFNKPVQIIGYRSNKITGTNIQTISIENDHAQLSIALKPAKSVGGKPVWSSRLFGILDFKSDGEWLTATVHVDHPRLWWPKDHGEQFLYEDQWTLTDQSGIVIDKKNVVFGIRTAQLLQEQDAFGTSYEIAINGRKIFCKGGNYIPQEMFPAQVTDDSVRELIRQMDLAHFNMVRVWGGGYYPDDVFYEECDKRGIMVWQDFMFACSMYPGTDVFLANVKREFDYHIPRMTSHPSVVLLNGNNEVDVAWKNWGFQSKYKLSGKAVTEIEKAYTDLFRQLLPSRISVFSTVPYVHTSPLSNWGKAEYYNHGSQHYWGVWHGKDPIEDFGNKSGRFNAEYGFQSFPEYSTLSTVIDKKDWNLNSEVMQHRQKSYVGNGMIKKHSDVLFGQTDDFETFIYYSQLTQARAVGIAISGHRTDWPRCSGTIYWQINDCWPAPTWSSIDYYGNWKALHYEVQKDFETIAVLAVERKMNQKEFYMVSDWTQEYTTDVRFDFYNLDGHWLEQHTFSVDIKPQTVISLPVFSLMKKPLSDYIVTASWRNKNGQVMQRTFYNKTSKTNTSSPPSVNITLQSGENGNFKLILETNQPLIDCWIYSEHKPFHLDRNFETLLPGKHEFTVNTNKQLSAEDIQVKFLTD